MEQPAGGMRIIPVSEVTKIVAVPKVKLWEIALACGWKLMAAVLSADENNVYTDDSIPFVCDKLCKRPRCVVGYEQPKLKETI